MVWFFVKGGKNMRFTGFQAGLANSGNQTVAANTTKAVVLLLDTSAVPAGYDSENLFNNTLHAWYPGTTASIWVDSTLRFYNPHASSVAQPTIFLAQVNSSGVYQSTLSSAAAEVNPLAFQTFTYFQNFGATNLSNSTYGVAIMITTEATLAIEVVDANANTYLKGYIV